ncbi:MAG: EamA family transporter [Cypionkella sp.]|uniref:DMT family transporter n=1 Tax=Cypionkella sp. TaxID=2811411 RepID=UPI002637AF0B|nr:DMT family transporter [Cypionkella sp.]MDB5661039.1 EamA family transporter [Cypionkella sp.]
MTTAPLSHTTAQSTPKRWHLLLILLCLGLGWGMTQPLGKIAASTGHKPFGLIFWQLTVCTLVLGTLTLLRGKRLSRRPEALRFYVVVAILGTLVPNATFYISVARLPSGIMSILISMVPLLAFPMAMALGMDNFSPRRLAGLGLGLAGVLLIALPNASLPDPAMAAFLPIAMIGPLFYAMESTYVAKTGTAGMDALQAMFGASLVGLILCTPIMLALGHFFPMPLPPGKAEWALIASSSLHALLYSAFVWLASKAGAVFASQSSYIVTASGVIWAMLLLGERFSPWVWAAAVVMLAGLSLVQPKMKVQSLQPLNE